MPYGEITRIDLVQKFGWIRESDNNIVRFFGFNESPSLNIQELFVGSKVGYELAVNPKRNEEKAVNVIQLDEDDEDLRTYGFVNSKHRDGYAFAQTKSKGEDVFVPHIYNVEYGDFISFIKEETPNGFSATKVKTFEKLYAAKNQDNSITPCQSDYAVKIDMQNALGFIEPCSPVEYIVGGNGDVLLLRSTYSLWQFAVCNRQEFIENLKDIIHPGEEWSYKVHNPNDPYPILRNYITHTFERLVDEDKSMAERVQDNIESEVDFHRKIKKLSVNGEEIAIFNTGLIDKYYREVYCLFKRNTDNKPGVPPYIFDQFTAPGSKSGAVLLSIKALPERARYYEKAIELFFDPDMEIYPDYEHIFERTSRIHLLKYKHLREDEFSDAIIEDLTQKINNALDTARRKILWNYKTAIPQYFTTKKIIQFLIPLCLEDPTRVDLAMAVDKDPGAQAYTGHTILPLELAYSNARLLSPEISGWLKPEVVSS